MSKIKISTDTKFIRARMKQKKKTPTNLKGLLKEEATEASEKEGLYQL